MAASYPSSIVSLSTKNDGDVVFASHVDALQDETIAVETGLLNGFQHNISPLNDNSKDLGDSAHAWRDAFVKRNLTHLGYAGTGAVLISNASKQIVEQALTNGQLMIGSTGGSPVAAVVTAGSGISVTNGAGAITIAAVGVLNKDFTEQTVTNTVAETSLLNGGAGYTVAASKLVAGVALRFRMTFDIINNSGGNVNYTIKLKLGGTTFFSVLLAFSTGISIGPQAVEAFVNANNASSSQRAFGRWDVQAANITDGGGATATSAIGGHSSLAIDMTASQVFDATITMGTASASASLKRWAATLELVQ